MLLADGAAVAAIVTQGEEMASTLAQNVFQIGFVVPDIHKGMAFFKDKLGVPEFLFLENPGLMKPILVSLHHSPCASPSAGAAIRRSN